LAIGDERSDEIDIAGASKKCQFARANGLFFAKIEALGKEFEPSEISMREPYAMTQDF
jgi:hypothetical protein